MDNISKNILVWMQTRPFVSLSLTLFAFLGYSNIFIFGYLFSVPGALRPFLDGYFYSTLALDFFMGLAVAGVLARLAVLLSRLLLANFPIKISDFLNSLGILTSITGAIFDIERVGENLDRQTKLRLKMLARWVRRNRLIVSIVTGVVSFSIFFLGRQSLWYIPICIIFFPIIWSIISKVELRRNFATPRNTTNFTPNRVVSAAIGFSLIYFAICVFAAGLASFYARMDTQVSVGMSGKFRNSSLIAVTSSGILVGEWEAGRAKIPFIFPVSAHFIPFDALSSVGQNN